MRCEANGYVIKKIFSSALFYFVIAFSLFFASKYIPLLSFLSILILYYISSSFVIYFLDLKSLYNSFLRLNKKLKDLIILVIIYFALIAILYILANILFFYTLIFLLFIIIAYISFIQAYYRLLTDNGKSFLPKIDYSLIYLFFSQLVFMIMIVIINNELLSLFINSILLPIKIYVDLCVLKKLGTLTI